MEYFLAIEVAIVASTESKKTFFSNLHIVLLIFRPKIHRDIKFWRISLVWKYSKKSNERLNESSAINRAIKLNEDEKRIASLIWAHPQFLHFGDEGHLVCVCLSTSVKSKAEELPLSFAPKLQSHWRKLIWAMPTIIKTVASECISVVMTRKKRQKRDLSY